MAWLATQGLTACLLKNERASYFSVARLRESHPEPERKRVRRGRRRDAPTVRLYMSQGVDPKPGELLMGRLKRG